MSNPTECGFPDRSRLRVDRRRLLDALRKAGLPRNDTLTSVVGTQRTCPARRRMSASLIGRIRSSAFRLSTTAVSMSLAGSCFSSELAPRPFHHGIRRRGGTIFWTALPSDERQVQADIRSHLIHRPARDIFPPLGGTQVTSYWI